MVKCFCDIIKTSLCGKSLRYCFFYTGEGKNGKTYLFKLIDKMVNNAFDVISKYIIVMKKSNTTLNTEAEKLDKCRIAYCEEFKNDDELNSEEIKKITGNGKMDIRTWHTKNYTEKPTACLHNSTNQMPKVNAHKAIMDRIVIIPFDNTFEKDINFEEKMESKIDLLFSYIINTGEINFNYE